MANPSKSGKKKQSAEFDKMQLPQEAQQAPMSLEELGACILAKTKELELGLKSVHQFSGELK